MLILIIIIAILAIPFIVALFTAKGIVITRSVTISRPKEDVFAYLKLLRNSEQYNKWTMTDPNMRKEYRGTDGTTGFVLAWDSDNKNVGKGEQEIKTIAEGQRIEYEIRFVKPMENKAKGFITTESKGKEETLVSWTFSGDRTYMMRVMYIILNLSKVLGNDLSESLRRLKYNLEH